MAHWTQQEKQTVAEMLRRNLSAGQIANRFERRSRNAVISLVNRHDDLRAIGFSHKLSEKAREPRT